MKAYNCECTETERCQPCRMLQLVMRARQMLHKVTGLNAHEGERIMAATDALIHAEVIATFDPNDLSWATKKVPTA